MGEALDNQVLLIKYAPGGQSLYENFRPPSAGVPEGKKAEAIGGQYRLLGKAFSDTMLELMGMGGKGVEPKLNILKVSKPVKL